MVSKVGNGVTELPASASSATATNANDATTTDADSQFSQLINGMVSVTPPVANAAMGGKPLSKELKDPGDDATHAALDVLSLLALPMAPITPVAANAGAAGSAADAGAATGSATTLATSLATSGTATDAAESLTAATTPTAIATATTTSNGTASNTASAATTTAIASDVQWLRAMTGAALDRSNQSNTVSDKNAAALPSNDSLTQAAASVQPDTTAPQALQQMWTQTAPMVALVGGQAHAERSETDADKADASINLSTLTAPSQAQPNGTALADAAALNVDARHQLHTPVGSHQWATELGNKLTLLATRDTQAATLYMTPADLGPVQVRIEMKQDQASVWFTAENADTRSALEQSLPKLREMFSAQGMSLTDAGVFGDRSRQQPAPQQSSTFTSAQWTGNESPADIAMVSSISLSLLDAYA